MVEIEIENVKTIFMIKDIITVTSQNVINEYIPALKKKGNLYRLIITTVNMQESVFTFDSKVDRDITYDMVKKALNDKLLDKNSK